MNENFIFLNNSPATGKKQEFFHSSHTKKMLKSISLKKNFTVGYKVIGQVHPETDTETEENVFKKSLSQAFQGQTDKDWSATYINSSVDVAMSYLSTKFEKFENCYLVRCFVGAETLDMFVPLVCSGDGQGQDKKLKLRLKDNLEIDVRNLKKLIFDNQDDFVSSMPLLQSIGQIKNSCLLTFDHDDLEIAYPHSLDRKKLSFEKILLIEGSNMTVGNYVSMRLPSKLTLFNDGASKQVITLKKHEMDDLRRCEILSNFLKENFSNEINFENLL